MQMTLQSSPTDSLDAMIGNTPLIEIHYHFDGKPGKIYAKYEIENMTGSVKDRMAVHIMRQAYIAGNLKQGDTIVEASSGNTGISFAAIGRALGHPVRIYMPNWMSQERVQLIRNFGAEVIPVSQEQGGFIGAVELAENYSIANENVFLPRQFESTFSMKTLEDKK